MASSEQTNYEEIRYEVEDGRARITLARPDKHNAMTAQLLDELEHALWEADDNEDVHCIILRGEGPSFCSGYDLTALGGKKRPGYRTGRSHDDDIWLIERSNRHIRSLWEVHKPCIAQVHGNCLAGGTDLAMACDMVIAADDARIGFPAARAMGALPNNLWVYHCGPQWAKRLQLTGDSVSGIDAEKIGLVLKSVPDAFFVCTAMRGQPQAQGWVNKLGLENHVLLLPYLPQGDLWRLFNRSLVYLSLSSHDGTPNTFLEAAACGCFPVVGDIESLREWISDGENGLLVNPRDAQAAAAAVTRAIRDSHLREHARERNRALLAERADMRKVRQQYSAFISQIM